MSEVPETLAPIREFSGLDDEAVRREIIASERPAALASATAFSVSLICDFFSASSSLAAMALALACSSFLRESAFHFSASAL